MTPGRAGGPAEGADRQNIGTDVHFQPYRKTLPTLDYLDLGGGALIWEGTLAARLLHEPEGLSLQRWRARPLIDKLLDEGRLEVVVVPIRPVAA